MSDTSARNKTSDTNGTMSNEMSDLSQIQIVDKMPESNLKYKCQGQMSDARFR